MIQIPSTVSVVTKSTVVKHGMPFKAAPTPRYKHLGTQQYYALFVNRARRLRLAVEALQDIPAIRSLSVTPFSIKPFTSLQSLLTWSELLVLTQACLLYRRVKATAR